MSDTVFAPRGEITSNAIDWCQTAGYDLEKVGKELGCNGDAANNSMQENDAQQCRRSAKMIRDLVAKGRRALDEALLAAGLFEALAVMGEELPIYVPGHEPWATKAPPRAKKGKAT